MNVFVQFIILTKFTLYYITLQYITIFTCVYLLFLNHYFQSYLSYFLYNIIKDF